MSVFWYSVVNLMPAFNAAVDAAAAGDNVTNLGRKYTRALYKMREQAIEKLGLQEDAAIETA
jgi:hypothetical protein